MTGCHQVCLQRKSVLESFNTWNQPADWKQTPPYPTRPRLHLNSGVLREKHTSLGRREGMGGGAKSGGWVAAGFSLSRTIFGLDALGGPCSYCLSVNVSLMHFKEYT